MVAIANTFEGGTAAGAITVANSGGSSGDAWTTVNDPANVTVTYETAAASHGSLGAKVITTANNVTGYMEIVHTAADRFAMRVYFTVTTLPGVASMIARMRGTTNTAAASVQLNSTNKLQLMDSTGTGVSGMTATNAISANTLYRLEYAVNKVTGVGEMAYYLGDSTTAQESLTSASGVNFGTEQIGKQRIGRVAGSTWQGTIYYDSFAAQDLTSGFIGPFSTAVSGSVALSGEGTLTFSGTPAVPGALGLSGSGTLGFASTPAIPGVLGLAGEGTVAFVGQPFMPGTLALGGEGTLVMENTISGDLALSGAGTLSMTGIPFVSSVLVLAGDGGLTFQSQPFIPAPAGFGGEGTISFAGQPNEIGSLVLSGNGALSFVGSPAVLGAVGYSGSGVLAGGSGMTLVSLASITSASGWTASGGTVLAVLGDASDETLITSSGDPSNVLFDGTFGAIVPPSGAFTVRVRTYKSSATSGTLTGKLYVNTTLKSTVSVSIPDVLGNVYLVFPAGDLATITAPDWAAGVRITLAATAT